MVPALLVAATAAAASALLATSPLVPAGTGQGPASGAGSATTGAASAPWGAAPVGSLELTAPADAVYVATTGDDRAPGTVDRPVASIARAAGLAPSGGTVVLRGGSYHEQVVVSRAVTLQSYPGEAAWLDGSVPVQGWSERSGVWVHDGWTTRFDHSPTYSRGAADGTTPAWSFVNPAHPMAAHPDQVWVDGVSLTQVASRDQVGPGDFFLDESTSQLVVGQDPTGRSVRASDLQRALSVRAAGVTVRGIGVRRYAPSVWMMGAVTLERPRALLEDVVVDDSATTGISALASDVTIRRTTVRRSGMLGVHANEADRLDLTGVVSEGNNRELFNSSPVSGGVKVTTTRGVTVRDSLLRANNGPGLWLDESVLGGTVVGNEISDNRGHGLSVELSGRVLVADNLVRDNGGNALKLNNSSHVAVWNNTIVGGGRPLNIVQDARRNDDPRDSAVDHRVPWPDPELPWQVRDVRVHDNVLALPGSAANCLLCVEDYSHQDTAETMGVVADGNLYVRAGAQSPRWTTVWSRGAGDPAVSTTLSAFRAATGQDRASRELVGATAISTSSGALAMSSAEQAVVARPLPYEVAATAGLEPGRRSLGASWLDGRDGPPVDPPTPPDPPSDPPSDPPAPGTTPGPSPDPDAVLLASDRFSRRVGAGWGTAETGGRWSASGGDRAFSVRGGRGVIAVPPGRSVAAELPEVEAQDVSVSGRVRLGGVRSHAAAVVLARLVNGVGDYRLRVTPARDGAWVSVVRRLGHDEEVLAGPVHAASARRAVRWRLEVVGSPAVVRARVWQADRPEPTSWTVQAEDDAAELRGPGSVAVLASRPAGTGVARVRLELDAIEVATRTPGTP